MMKQLHEWMEEQFAERKVEPNSSLGQAIRYTLKHWEGLTCFLRERSVP
ncbi:MAG: transposase [Acidobacteria bacterium]|nr:transposase [Acidobacteriota bacterium]